MDYGESFAIICLRLEKQTIKPTCVASIPASLYADALRKISSISGFLTSNLITSLHMTNLSFTAHVTFCQRLSHTIFNFLLPKPRPVAPKRAGLVVGRPAAHTQHTMKSGAHCTCQHTRAVAHRDRSKGRHAKAGPASTVASAPAQAGGGA